LRRVNPLCLIELIAWPGKTVTEARIKPVVKHEGPRHDLVGHRIDDLDRLRHELAVLIEH